MSAMRPANRSRAAPRGAAVLLGLALVLAGCGGSSSHPNRAARARYVAEANAICATAQAQTAPLIKKVTAAAPSLVSGTAGSAQRLAPVVAQLHVVAAASLAKLRALPQPAGDHAAIENFLAPLGSVVGAISQAASALAQGQSAQAFALLQAAQPNAQQVTRAAQAYGLRQCGSVVSILS